MNADRITIKSQNALVTLAAMCILYRVYKREAEDKLETIDGKYHFVCKYDCCTKWVHDHYETMEVDPGRSIPTGAPLATIMLKPQ